MAQTGMPRTRSPAIASVPFSRSRRLVSLTMIRLLSGAGAIVRASSVVHAVGRQPLGQIILLFERIRRTRFGIDERRQVLGICIGEAAWIEIRHAVANDAGERIDPGGTGAIVPRIRAPQRA